jgi:hypothetical protein
MKKESSIEQLISWMKANDYLIDVYLEEAIDQALENHKGEILFAHMHNRCSQEQTYECSIKAIEDAENYYNETFKSE